MRVSKTRDIERLEKENARLRAAIRAWARHYRPIDDASTWAADHNRLYAIAQEQSDEQMPNLQ